MNGQNEKEKQKNADDDFDFFKKPKTVNLQKSENENLLIKEAAIEQNNKQKNEEKLKTKIVLFGIFVPMALCFILSSNQSKTIYVVKHDEKIITQPVEIKPTNNSQESFNVDYSKLNKDDAERVKKVMDQFKDIQNTLIETNNTNSKK